MDGGISAVHIQLPTSLYGPLTLPSLPSSPGPRPLDLSVERVLGRKFTSGLESKAVCRPAVTAMEPIKIRRLLALFWFAGLRRRR